MRVVGGGGVAGVGGKVSRGGAAVVGLVVSWVLGAVLGERPGMGLRAFAVQPQACRSR